MHPLVVRLPNHLGDVCMSLPALNALTERFRLCLVGRPWASALFHAYEWPVLPLRGPRWTECRQLYALRRKAQIDDALLLTNSFSTALHMRLAGLRPRGYALDGRSLLLVRAVPAHASRDLHMVPYYHALATAAFDLPAAPLPKQLGLRLRADAHRRARDILAQAAVGEQPYVLLCPVATGLHRGQIKAWPGFARLAEALRARGLRVLAMPGPGEREAVQAAVPSAELLAQADVDAFAAVLAGAQLVVANDSGAGHLAAAVGAPLISVFGVTDPSRTRPWGERITLLGSAEGWPPYESVFEAACAALDSRAR